jgi:hypothetical protein
MKKVIILDTKKEDLEGEGIFLIDSEKISCVAVERSTIGADSQKFGIRISGFGVNHFFHISYSRSSKMDADKQKHFLMKLQSRLAKDLWKDTTLETSMASEQYGL